MSTTAIRERSILMSGPMVRAILEGRKTQTRRVIKPQPRERSDGWYEWGYLDGKPSQNMPRRSFWHAETWQRESGTAPIEDYYPHGRPGDRLWVRETWATDAVYDRLPPRSFTPLYTTWYQADQSVRSTLGPFCEERPGRWRPSIHMPRWASRLTLEITEVRAERLQEISPEDAWAEGVQHPTHPSPRDPGNVDAFCVLWDQINGKRPDCTWSANPWVWALTFRRLETEARP